MTSKQHLQHDELKVKLEDRRADLLSEKDPVKKQAIGKEIEVILRAKAKLVKSSPKKIKGRFYR